MIIACEECHRQLDVGALKPGSKARCFCGKVNEVPSRVPLSQRMMHCRSCGAGLREGSPHCEYCTAEVQLGDRGLGDACPSCMRRLSADSSFCSSCGIAIAPQTIVKALQSLDCPRCKGQLAECRHDQEVFVECTSCAGIWLEEGAFRARFERGRREHGAVSKAGAEATVPRDEMRYLPCPVCRDMMIRVNFANTGVIIDWCGKHGYWFDTHELERILAIAAKEFLEWPRRNKSSQATTPPNSMGIVITEPRPRSILEWIQTVFFDPLI